MRKHVSCRGRREAPTVSFPSEARRLAIDVAYVPSVSTCIVYTAIIERDADARRRVDGERASDHCVETPWGNYLSSEL